MADIDKVKTLFVNDVSVDFMPDSVELNRGGGERKTTASMNGGKVVHNTMRDAASRVGVVKFSMPNTQESRNRAEDWDRLADGSITAKVIFDSGDVRKLSGGSLVKSPDFKGESFDIEIHGSEIR